MQNNTDYRGKRALVLTRVSTAKQEEKYSHGAQERQVREKLIVPLGLRIVDEKKHIIHDAYSIFTSYHNNINPPSLTKPSTTLTNPQNP